MKLSAVLALIVEEVSHGGWMATGKFYLTLGEVRQELAPVPWLTGQDLIQYPSPDKRS